VVAPTVPNSPLLSISCSLMDPGASFDVQTFNAAPIAVPATVQ
jgi:hypothetical protein